MSGAFVLQGLGAAHVLGPVQTVGRSAECDIVIPDVTVSRAHARIVVEGGRVVVHDLESRNGTFVNGVRVSASEIPLGGTLGFGASEMRLARGGAEQVVAAVSDLSTDRLQYDPRPPTHLLSAAEARVLHVLLEGLTEKEAARRLHLSQHTVHNHVRAIYQTLNVTSRPALLRLLLGRDAPATATRDEG